MKPEPPYRAGPMIGLRNVDGDVVFVRAGDIRSFQQSNSGTKIVLRGDDWGIFVPHPFEEIAALLKDGD